MKKLLVLASIFMFQACSSNTQTVMPLDQSADQAVINKASSSDHNPMFLDKIKMGKNYKVLDSMKKHANASNSICGTDNKQEINSYDGSLGQSVEFVKEHQSAVAAMAKTGTDNSSKFCSGTMISEDLFLTASHCVEGGSATSNYLAFNYEKAKGAQTLLQQSHFKITEVVEEGGSSTTDYAILRIDGKPGAKFGYAKINLTAPVEGDVFTIIQHPSGKPKQVDVGHRSKYTSGVYMGYSDLDTEPGSSGSGVLDAQGQLVGVHTNGGCRMSGGDNKAVMMTEIAKVSKTIQALAKTSKGKIVKKK